MTRLILCRVGEPPHVTWLCAAPGGGGHEAALEALGQRDRQRVVAPHLLVRHVHALLALAGRRDERRASRPRRCVQGPRRTPATVVARLRRGHRWWCPSAAGCLRAGTVDSSLPRSSDPGWSGYRSHRERRLDQSDLVRQLMHDTDAATRDRVIALCDLVVDRVSAERGSAGHLLPLPSALPSCMLPLRATNAQAICICSFRRRSWLKLSGCAAEPPISGRRTYAPLPQGVDGLA